MKIRKTIVYGIAVMLSLSTLAGCTRSDTPQAANELRFSLDDISEVSISYDEEAITFYEAESSELIIKEYMTQNKKAYCAKVKQDDNRIQISEGGKPFLKHGFTRYIEVYMPVSYAKNLTITTTDGDIDLSGVALELSALRIDSTKGNVQISKVSASNIHLSSTSGTLDLEHIEGDNIRLETTSGNITCTELTGAVAYTTTSGNLDVKSAVGSGNYNTSNSGKLEVIYTDVTGNLSFFNKNDDIHLTIPKDLEFKFDATSKNGSISTTFEGDMSVEGRTARGTVGNNPAVTIKTETNNGNIQVTQ